MWLKSRSKTIFFSLIISLLIIQLSVPAYAPNRRPDYIEWMPLVPIGDVEMDPIHVTILSITGSGWGGYSPDTGGSFGNISGQFAVGDNIRGIVIDCIGYGLMQITNPEGQQISYPTLQRMSLNVMIADSEETGLIELTGHSNLTVITPEGRVSFKGILDGNGTVKLDGDGAPKTNFIDAISFLVSLQYRAGSTQEYAGEPSALIGGAATESTNRIFLSLNMVGELTDPGILSAHGQLLTIRQ
jgi:hypothetical protein